MNLPLIDEVEDRPAHPAGTLSGELGRLPLVAMAVEVDVVGLSASMRVVQRFRNAFDRPIEATYVFPLPDRAAVTGFTVTVGERRIEGVLMEREQARATYDAAIAAGHLAATAEEDRPDVFATRVGNLRPGEEAEVELHLAGPLPYDGGEAVVRVPLAVAPRYIPGAPLDGTSVGEGTHPDTDAVPDASRITPPVLVPGSPNPVDLAVIIRLDPAGLSVSDLRSTLHSLADAPEPASPLAGPVTVRLQPGERLDRDFVLRFWVEGSRRRASAAFTPDAGGDAGAGEGTLCVTLLAPPAAHRPRDVVLVLDRSGSMSGWKIVAARRAAARIVDSLGPDDRLAVLAFDNVVDRPHGAGGGLQPATDANRFAAVEFLARLEARGGTEMHPALRQAFAMLDPGAPDARDDATGRDPTCILVTDGQVGNEDQLVGLVSAAPGRVRMFTIGIDRAVNTGLLQRLAAAGGGRCDLVESEDRLDDVLTSLHRRISPPALLDVDVAVEAAGDVHLLEGTAAPAGRTDCFPGAPLVLWRRYRGRAGTGAKVVVRASDPAGRPVTEDAEVVVSASPAAAPSWARALVRDLEDRYAATQAAPDREELARRIVETSLRHRMLSRFTAFVAVDPTRSVEPGTVPQPVVQPVELPSGWDPLLLAGPARSYVGRRAGGETAERVMQALRSPAAGVTGIPDLSATAAPAAAAPAAAAPTAAAATPTAATPVPHAVRRRVADVVADVEALVGPGREGPRPDRLSVLADVCELLDDMRSVGLTGGPLVEALARLDAALRSELDIDEVQAALDGVRRALGQAPATARPAFWR